MIGCTVLQDGTKRR